MKSLLSFVAAFVMVCGLGANWAKAGDCHEARLVQNWYARYLHRAPDGGGLENWVCHLRRGTSPELVEAAILGSAEYYHNHGCSPEGYVTSLYEDILGRRPCHREVGLWVNRLGACGCRMTVAKEFLCAARRELTTPPGAGVYVPDLSAGPRPGLVPVRRVPLIEPPGSGVSLRVRIGR